MRKTFSLRKVSSLLLAMICIITMLSVSAYAVEDSTKQTTNESQITPRVIQTDMFTLNNNVATATCYLSKQVTPGSTKKTYQVVKLGSDCSVVARFVNQTTGAASVIVLTANGGQYTEDIGVTIPAGYYDVSFASTPCTVLSCWCVFKF